MKNPIPPKYRRVAAWALGVLTFLAAAVEALRRLAG